ncbi:ferredoxin--NADP(+) reductase [Rhodobacter xanthinilyticus]|uniref:Ferredoxin--NADP(+) reductase n=1 Tax=Rhodobacter xanthinilyticus TaxID=1850250 RepID=A0A1D9MAF9_9RHOB|nr:PDR/VanB family oxidoreductase [Rhodobacter xanthinilyticus]AOZ68856.1 ferredoxin--NADP(+) reductase [Rhodobacter xanthinilyticus]
MSALTLRVTEITPLSPLVTRFRFEHPEGAGLPLFSGGAHVVVEMPDAGVLRRNAYSLISDPLDGSGYEIAVRREDGGRGGSRFLHTKVSVGDLLRVNLPVNLFALDLRAKKQLMIAGGIGITPFLAQLKQIARLQIPFELHYAARSRAEAAGVALLPDLPQIHVHISDEGNRMDLGAILSGQPLGTHVYTCGPEGLIAAVDETAARLGWPKGALHAEAFLAPPPGAPFTVTLTSGREIEVGAHQSLLEALEAAEVAVDWSCRGGACGRCETGVSACHGRIEHHDHWLSDEEKASQTKIMPCVSRFVGETLTLDL